MCETIKPVKVKTKACIKCKKSLPITEFRVVDRKRDKRYTYCRACTKIVNNGSNEGKRHMDLMKAKEEWLRKRAAEKPE